MVTKTLSIVSIVLTAIGWSIVFGTPWNPTDDKLNRLSYVRGNQMVQLAHAKKRIVIEVILK